MNTEDATVSLLISVAGQVSAKLAKMPSKACANAVAAAICRILADSLDDDGREQLECAAVALDESSRRSEEREHEASARDAQDDRDALERRRERIAVRAA